MIKLTAEELRDLHAYNEFMEKMGRPTDWVQRWITKASEGHLLAIRLCRRILSERQHREPRYDDVYFEGAAALDSEPVEKS